MKKILYKFHKVFTDQEVMTDIELKPGCRLLLISGDYLDREDYKNIEVTLSTLNFDMKDRPKLYLITKKDKYPIIAYPIDKRHLKYRHIYEKDNIQNKEV